MSKIEWTEDTCNAIIGCTKVSPGCDHCYAERMANRLACIEHPQLPAGMGGRYNLVVDLKGKWNGKTVLVTSALDKVLKRKKPTMYFMSSMGDMFHESVPFHWILKVWQVMAACPQHTFQILTKRPENMLKVVKLLYENIPLDDPHFTLLPNVLLGTTAENQEQADKRIPELLKCPAAKRFVSIEPMLEPVDLQYPCFNGSDSLHALEGIDWVICGGESGPGARPMHPDWARSIRDQCKAAGVPFFMKQLHLWKAPNNIQENRISGRILGKPEDWPLFETAEQVRLRYGECTPKRVLIKKIEEFPEDLRIQEYPK